MTLIKQTPLFSKSRPCVVVGFILGALFQPSLAFSCGSPQPDFAPSSSQPVPAPRLEQQGQQSPPQQITVPAAVGGYDGSQQLQQPYYPPQQSYALQQPSYALQPQAAVYAPQGYVAPTQQIYAPPVDSSQVYVTQTYAAQVYVPTYSAPTYSVPTNPNYVGQPSYPSQPTQYYASQSSQAQIAVNQLPPAYSQNDPNFVAWNISKDLKTEPMLLLDTTGSMYDPVKEGSSTKRHELVKNVMSVLVKRAQAKDSAGAHENDGGGLRTITFADKSARDMDDLNSSNLDQKWDEIEWNGESYIVPGWNKLLETYDEEFTSKGERPTIMALIVTDGQTEDLEQFEMLFNNGKNPPSYVTFALLGFDSEEIQAKAAQAKQEGRLLVKDGLGARVADHGERYITHAEAHEAFLKLQRHSPDRVKVIHFGTETRPEFIADTLDRMLPKNH